MTTLLLDKGSNINAFDKRDRRAIHYAAYMGAVDVVKVLLERGAEAGCTDKQVRFTCNPPPHYLIFPAWCSE